MPGSDSEKMEIEKEMNAASVTWNGMVIVEDNAGRRRPGRSSGKSYYTFQNYGSV